MIYTHPSERHAKQNNFVIRAVNKDRDTRIVHYYERHEWFQVNADKSFERLTLEESAKRAADMYRQGGYVFYGIDPSKRFDWLVRDRVQFFGGGVGVDELRDFVLHEEENATKVDDWNL